MFIKNIKKGELFDWMDLEHSECQDSEVGNYDFYIQRPMSFRLGEMELLLASIVLTM